MTVKALTGVIIFPSITKPAKVALIINIGVTQSEKMERLPQINLNEKNLLRKFE